MAKDKNKVTGPAPKPRNTTVQDMVSRGWGSGKHQNREDDVAKGRSRKEKHKKDLRNHEASAQRVATLYLASQPTDADAE